MRIRHLPTPRGPGWPARAGGAVLLLALAGCASDPARLPTGLTRAQALERLGPPTATYPLPDGERLQYSREPAGQQVFNVDIDASGQVRSVEQVLDEDLFAQTIQVDRWREADVLREFGPPAEISRVHSFNGVVWTWRLRQVTLDRLLHIFIDRSGTVRRYQVTDEQRRGWVDRP